MKRLLLYVSLFLVYSSALKSLPILTTGSGTSSSSSGTSTSGTSGTSTAASTTTASSATASTSTTVKSMNSTVESNMLSQIASIQNASIDNKIQTLTSILNQASKLNYISPAVQNSYYAAINSVYSSLMAGGQNTMRSISQFISLLNRIASNNQILNSDQRSIAKSLISPLNQQYQSLASASTSKKSSSKGNRKIR